jgi:hypothetical protein
LQRLSTTKVYVVTRSTAGHLVAAIDPDPAAIAVRLSDRSRILSAMAQPPGLTRLPPNVFRLGDVGSALVEDLVADLVAALEVVEVVKAQFGCCGCVPIAPSRP